MGDFRFGGNILHSRYAILSLLLVLLALTFNMVSMSNNPPQRRKHYLVLSADQTVARESETFSRTAGRVVAEILPPLMSTRTYALSLIQNMLRRKLQRCLYL